MKMQEVRDCLNLFGICSPKLNSNPQYSQFNQLNQNTKNKLRYPSHSKLSMNLERKRKDLRLPAM